MRIEYDPQSDAAYIYFVQDIGAGGVAKTYACDPAAVDGQIHLDFDDKGRLLGLEILDASSFLPAKLLAKAPGPGQALGEAPA
jgi:uncharacterized protein YuzE